MKVYHISDLAACRKEISAGGRSFIALGNFDGLHLGHAAILQACKEGAQERNAMPGVFTFTTGKAKQLTTLEERLALFQKAGIEVVWLAEFDAIRDQSPEEFVGVTLAHMGAIGVACGFNFRFGCHAAGDVKMLDTLCSNAGIDCRVAPPVTIDDGIVSSTQIRRLLAAGDLSGVEHLLGRPWSITGRVAYGRAVGGKVLSSPTLNLCPDAQRILPPFGVYFTKCVVEGVVYPAITNLGIRPTFGESEVLSETHLLDFSGDLYGKQVEVQFLAFHRSERKFSSPDELAQVIANDITHARRYFAASGASMICGVSS